MLITLQFADFKIANHMTDPSAVYISSLDIRSFSTKKGVAADKFQFTIPMEALDALNESFAYLIYNTPVKLYLDNKLTINGQVSEISIQASNVVNFSVESMTAWHLKQMFSPSVEAGCQNQTYSKHCGLSPVDFSYHFTTVEIDCMTGYADIQMLPAGIILGGNLAPIANNNNSQFFDLASWVQAIVVINGKYKSRVVKVADDKIYFAMNYMDSKVTTVTLDVYLKCDRTYGVCYSRFDNSHNFWGFPNVGRKVSTFDIFSATSLEYCGEELVGGPLESCTTDTSFFGINL